MTMTKPQRARWKSRMDRADDAIASARNALMTTFEVCPQGETYAGETKDEACERLAAEMVAHALVSLGSADHWMGAAHAHLDWEREKAVREFPGRARKLLEELAEDASGMFKERIRAVLDGKATP